MNAPEQQITELKAGMTVERINQRFLCKYQGTIEVYKIAKYVNL